MSAVGRAAEASCRELVRLAEALLRESSSTPRLDAELLLAASAGISRASLFAFPERVLAEHERSAFERHVSARASGVPIAYLLGRKEFFSLTLTVTPAVLVPRPETELLVEQALKRVPSDADCRVLDLGTGSGAVALAIKHARPRARVVASDSSAAALAVARENGQALGLEVTWRHGDWYAALEATERYELIVSNPPYVERSALGADLRHEPRQALDGGSDGLDALGAIVSGAARHIVPGGWLLLEHGAAQRGALLDRVRGLPAFVRSVGYRDLAGHDRVLALERCADA